MARLVRHARLRELSTASEVWTEINGLAARPGMVNMGQGFPDFEGSLVAREAASKALLSENLNQYSAQAGLPELRQAVSDFYARFHPSAAPYDPATEVCITSSGQEALTASLRACLAARPGRDGVLCFEPFYPFLSGAVELAGGSMQTVRLEAPGFAIDAERLRAAVRPSTAAVVLNSPHNPTGRVATPAELAAVAEVCTEHDLLAVSDEVHGGHFHLRLGSSCP